MKFAFNLQGQEGKDGRNGVNGAKGDDVRLHVMCDVDSICHCCFHGDVAMVTQVSM